MSDIEDNVAGDMVGAFGILLIKEVNATADGDSVGTGATGDAAGVGAAAWDGAGVGAGIGACVGAFVGDAELSGFEGGMPPPPEVSRFL